MRETLVSTHPAGRLSGEEKLREQLGGLYGKVTGYDGRPTDSQLAEGDKLVAELRAFEQRFDSFLAAELAPVNRVLERRGGEPLARMTRDEWEAGEGGMSSSASSTTLSKMQWAWRIGLIGSGLSWM